MQFPIRLLIGGDVCPVGRSEPLLRNGQAAPLFAELESEFAAADFTVANLECPLVEDPAPISKSGPILGASAECARGLARVPFSALCLANNHVLDHGEAGLRSTLRACAEAGLPTFGAGSNLAEAQAMLIGEFGGTRVGFVAMAENERCVATEQKAGANPLDPIGFVRQVRTSAEHVDVLIVLVHGGPEFYPFPTPRLQRVCRFMVELGAKAVICQHSHCAGAWEKYHDGYIVYGQGNLLFDWPGRDQIWHRGFLVCLEVGPDLQIGLEWVPFTQYESGLGLRRMSAELERVFRDEVEQRSALIRDEAFVRTRWECYCRERFGEYLSGVLGHGSFLQRLARRTPLLKWLYSREALYRVANLIRCESHQEVLLTGFEQFLTALERERFYECGNCQDADWMGFRIRAGVPKTRLEAHVDRDRPGRLAPATQRD